MALNFLLAQQYFFFFVKKEIIFLGKDERNDGYRGLTRTPKQGYNPMQVIRIFNG